MTFASASCVTAPTAPVPTTPLRVTVFGIDAIAVPSAEVAAKLGAVGLPSQSCVVVPTEPVEVTPCQSNRFWN